MEDSISFGKWLKRERGRRHLSQKQLGALVAYSDAQIRKIEKGHRRFAKEPAERLAEVFEVSHGDRSTFIKWARGDLPSSHLTIPTFNTDRVPDYAPEEGERLRLLGISCSGKGCNGQDPGATGCSGKTVTVQEVKIRDNEGRVVGWVELRWSELCQTNWSRVQNTTDNTSLSLRTYLRDAAGTIITATLREARRGRGIYGKMWYAPTGVTYVKACGVLGDYEEVCTDLY